MLANAGAQIDPDSCRGGDAASLPGQDRGSGSPPGPGPFLCARHGHRLGGVSPPLSRSLSPTASAQVAANTRRWWKNSSMSLKIVMPNRWFAERELPSLGA